MLVIALATAALLVPDLMAAQLPTPPVAERRPRVDTLHGEPRTDDYFWLRNRNDPKTISYLEAENVYTAAALQHTEPLQEQLYQEMLGRIKQTDLSVPERFGPYYYYSRTEEGKQYPIFARKRESLDAPEEILLDQNVMAEGHEYYTITSQRISPDHQRLAFLVDSTGSEQFVMMVRDLRTGEILPDRVPDVAWSVEWAEDNRTLLYTTFDSAQRSDKVWRHTLGDDPARAQLVFHEPDVLYNVGLSKTKSQRFFVIEAAGFNNGDVRVIDASTPAAAPRLIAPRARDLEYSVEHHGDDFLVLTNDGAQNFQLMRAPIANPARANWKPFIAHRADVLVQGMEVFRDWLVLYERGNATRGIQIRSLRDGAAHHVSFPEEVFTFAPGANRDYDSAILRFSYSSPMTPPSVYDYDMAQRTRTLLKKTEVLGGYDPSLYTAERIWATADDGVRVPVTLIYRGTLERDASRPVLLYAYGSYGSSSDPGFSSARLSLLDRGVVWAIAHIRGGQEMGRQWYDDGKLLNKKNTFSDYVAVAQHLVTERYTATDRLVGNGGSAGGLLMGAVVNMRPDLFRAVVADVPFVDVINTMLDASIPLTAQEWDQWGNPTDSTYYAYMRSYSPYDNVERKAYPALLITTGLNDPRVAYWEPAKWAARLRAMKTDSNPLLLRTNMGAGHGGSSGRYDALRETAIRYAFMLDQFGPALPRPAM